MDSKQPSPYHSLPSLRGQLNQRRYSSHFPIHIDWRSLFHSHPTTGLNSSEAWCQDFSCPTRFSPPFSKLNKKSRSRFSFPATNPSYLNKRTSSGFNLTTLYPPTPLSPPSTSGPFIFPEFSQSDNCFSTDMNSYGEGVCVNNQSNLVSASSPPPTENVHARSSSLPVFLDHTPQRRRSRPSLEVPHISLEGRTCSSTVLSVDIADKLSLHLPSRYRLTKSWKLLYNIDQHGLSMTTMFRRCKNQGPCVIAIRDSEDQVFGAYISEPLEPSPSYFGSGECFLWRAECNNGEATRITTYEWSGLNRYLILCEPEYISIGGGDGKYGLWLDKEFDRGISQTCTTFHNSPLAGSQEEFRCIEFEVWGVGS